MAGGSTGPYPNEDTGNRFATEQDAVGRNLPRRWRKKNYTLVDGPQSGTAVDYFTPLVDTEAVTAVDLDAADDEVAIFGAEGGGAGTRRIIDVDSAGRPSVKVEDGLDIAQGATTDAAVTTNTTGTISGKLRGLVAILADVWDSATTALRVKLRVGTADVSNSNPVPVSDAGGTLTVDQATHDSLNTNANLQIGDADAPGGAGVVTASTPRVVLASDGNKVQGVTASGSPPTTNPVLVSGWDGTNIRTLLTDSGGRRVVVGAAADGSAPVGNPVLISGSDGTNVQTVLTDTSGNQGAYLKHVQTTLGDTSSNAPYLPAAVDGVAIVPAVYAYLFNGTNWSRFRGNTTGLSIIGGLGHDAADVANNFPAKVGARAVPHGADPTAVAEQDVTHLIANRDGVPFTIGGHPNIRTREYRATTAKTDAAIITVSAGTKIVLTYLVVTFDEAGTTGTSVRIGFGAATLPGVPADGASADGIVLSHPGTIAGSGLPMGDGSGIIGIGADGEDLRITCEAPTSGDLRVVVKWFEIES